MKAIWSWLPVLAAVTGVVLATSGSGGDAWAGARPAGGHGAHVITVPARQTVTDHVVSGTMTSVSCLTASRCVAVGSRGSHGVVVTLTNGVQRHAAVLRRSSVIDSVSCRKSGCWAIGHPVHGTAAYVVRISSAGRPATERTVPVRARTTLDAISCASIKSCEIAGADNRTRPSAIEIGTWNGRRLRLHRVTVKGSKRMSMRAISCWHSDCEAVGGALAGSGFNDYIGLILTTAGGNPARLNADSGYPFADSVSCISANTCYATASGPVLTVTRGVVSHGQDSAGPFYAIECAGSECEAAGGLPKPQFSTSDGWLQSLSAGTLGASIDDGATYGFTGIGARSGGGFIAIGSSATAQVGTDVTVG